jgi:hypothetical protein
MKKSHDKAIRKRAREIVSTAHERELNQALDLLYQQFQEWRARKIDAFALSDRIHEFHQQTAREIWKRYETAGPDEMLIARALRLGLLTEEEVGSELIERLGPFMTLWKDGATDEQ